MWRRIASAGSLLVAAVLALSVCACSDAASTKECERLLDHLVKLEISSGGTKDLSPDMAADLDKQKKDLKAQLQDGFMKQCKERTPAKLVRCALKARDKRALAKCDEG